MAVTWSPCPDSWPASVGGRSGLRLVDGGGGLPTGPPEAGEGWYGAADVGLPVRSRRHRAPVEVRRRRTLLAAMGVLLVALALPLSGTGGHSHPIGSALAESVHPGVYTVRPGDSLWSIAERLDPSADPRPLVVQLTAQTGSGSVVPGERIALP